MPGLYNPGIIISNSVIRPLHIINFIPNVSCRAMSKSQPCTGSLRNVARKQLPLNQSKAAGVVSEYLLERIGKTAEIIVTDMVSYFCNVHHPLC